MPRKADALDAAKISSRGQAIEMGEVVEIPKRGRKPKLVSAATETPSLELAPEPIAVPPQACVVQEAPAPVKVDAYLILKTTKIWINGSLITLNEGKKVTDNSFGPNTLAKLRSRQVDMKLIE